MAQYYRNQNESGRSQDYPRAGQRNAVGRDRNDSSGRERYETGNEHRYSPDFEDRSNEGRHFDDTSGGFEGDRSYSAGGYPEEFGYRRESYPGRERDNSYRFSEQAGRDQNRSGGYYSSSGRHGSQDPGSRDFGHSGFRSEPHRQDPYRGEDVNRARGGYHGSGSDYSSGQRSSYAGGTYSPYAAQGDFARDFGNNEAQWQSQQSQLSHRGRGPKGYERSDERLKELICERLTDDPAIDASEVTIEITNKVVKLTGSVDERRIKYLIEDVIEQTGGVRDIDNQLRVQSPAGSQSQASQYGTASSESGYAGRDNKSGTLGSSSGGSSTGMPSTKRN